ncbi:MAG: NADH-quinone oxidoreductase subunit H [Defluviitaleaceae bacterium]|nr:NADH-quinone oxidoreductase subunit H [Defluviitaleaceae bacterium]
MTLSIWLIPRAVAVLLLAPLIGGLLTGFDRIVTARMQKRKGPPLLQPFYDVIKLLQKEATTVNKITRYFVTMALVFSVFTVLLFGLGADILLSIFAFTIACIFFVLAGYSSNSPYSTVGAERELIQIMCYEPMILLYAFGYYQATGTFRVTDAFSLEAPPILKLPFIFIGLMYVITVKLRKSPFDLSMSHHGHQEIVKGITTELTGICMAMVEIIHWFEIVFALGLVFLMFVWAEPLSILLALAVCIVSFFSEVIIDNAFARFKWTLALKASWLVIAAAGGINLLLLGLFG